MCWRLLSLLLLTGALASASQAEEGFWPFDALPREQLREKYQCELSDSWLEHLRLSAVRFGGTGGSAAFVSADGLVITAQHVAGSALEALSTGERNLLRDGFLARAPAEELRCPGLAFSVLQSTADVTARVQAAVVEPAGAAEARRRVIDQIEQETLRQTGLRSEVVRQHRGAQYVLHRYQTFADVRLVFAPALALVQFGDPNRPEDPRFSFDAALFRVYENGRPLRRTHYLRWSKAGAAEGELTFLAGHPLRSQRFLAEVECDDLRDRLYPEQIRRLQQEEAAVRRWAGGSGEMAPRVSELLVHLQGQRKGRERRQAALSAEEFRAGHRQAEAAFRQRMAAEPEKYAAALRAFALLPDLQGGLTAFARHFPLLGPEAGWIGATRLARLLVDPKTRAVRQEREMREEAHLQALAEIARARRMLEPRRSYPDATGTLRLSYGIVKRFGDYVPEITEPSDLGGVLARSAAHGNRPPFELPDSFLQAGARLNPKCPLNFVTAHDSAAGSSGSPVVNRAGEFVGLLYDGVRGGRLSEFSHDERRNAAVNVHSTAILEMLEVVHGASELAAELRTGKR